MTDRLRIAHLRIAPQWAILRWAILTFTAGADGCNGCLNWKGMDWERMKSDAEEKRCKIMH